MKKLAVVLLVLAGIVCINSLAEAETIGKITVKKSFTGNDVLKINAIDDPQNPFVTCYVSSISSGKFLAMADPSNASISCRQIKEIPKDKKGKMIFNKTTNYKIFSQKKSILSKTQKIGRFYDAKRNVLVYAVYTTKAYGGSFKNSISVVPLR